MQNQLLVDLKDAGIWSKLDVFYVFATDGDSDFASINWKDPNNFEIFKVSSPTFTTNKGFEGNGTSAYLDTNWNLANDSVNYQQNNAGVFVGVTEQPNTPATQNRLTGTTSSNYNSAIRVDSNFASGFNRSWINSTTNLSEAFDTKVDDTIYFANRTGSSAINTRNTDLATPYTNSKTGSTASNALPNYNQLFFRGSSFYAPSGSKIGISGFGSNFSSSEMDDIETAWYTNYYTNI